MIKEVTIQRLSISIIKLSTHKYGHAIAMNLFPPCGVIRSVQHILILSTRDVFNALFVLQLSVREGTMHSLAAGRSGILT